MSAPARTGSADWERAVSVREDPTVQEVLLARLGQGMTQRSIGVTDLLSLRRAFYRRVVPPVPISPERQDRLEEGRALHRTLGSRLAGEGILEARVRRSGLVGRIDILADIPIEVKTSSAVVEPTALSAYRPDHIEQLAMYCGLLDRPVGRLLTLATRQGEVSDVQAVDVAFGSPADILVEMERRAALLRTAWADSRVDGLPRCPWYGRGCEYSEAAVCSCRGNEAPLSPSLTDGVAGVTERDDVRDRVRQALTRPMSKGPPVGRYREILYPRRAYFDRTASTPPDAAAWEAPAFEPDLYARLGEAVEGGPAGEVARLPGRSEEPEEEVAGFRGRPYLLKTSRAHSRLRADELLRRAPQYALELGLRCATTGTDSGRVVMGYERADTDRDRVQVFELRFAPLTPFSRLYRDRGRALTEAVRDGDPSRLPACPAWMESNCPHRAVCGCGVSGPRDTR